MIPQRVDPLFTAADIANLSEKWRISCELALKLVVLASVLPYQITIISGWRDAAEQQALRDAGRPTAADHLSTHMSCPVATGADLQISVAVTGGRDGTKAMLGAGCAKAGLRWGGGSRADRYGIPSDWNHVDLGPRT